MTERSAEGIITPTEFGENHHVEDNDDRVADGNNTSKRPFTSVQNLSLHHGLRFRLPKQQSKNAETLLQQMFEGELGEDDVGPSDMDDLDDLFDQEEVKTSVSPQFSSKTLKPKKEPEESGGGTRPRNRSLSLKQPEAVYNELSLILEKRRQNLETKPTPPDRPRNLTLETKACPPSFPPYSKVNKVSRQQKDVPESDSAVSVPRSNVPPRSFLHSFAQSGKLSQLQSREENKNAFSTFKGW